ncbi:MAG: rhomboid family intramembrane serine protease, partial [Phycisphaerae bacterium]|nr:rhomboid family intramembrane serine protease [Phycisphaerae bacterium]
MSLGNRPYWRGEQGSREGYYSSGIRYGGGMRMGLPKPTPAVLWLLIANVAMFILQQLIPSLTVSLAAVPVLWWQPWRYITFQFLHGGPWHLVMNMIGLYFLGMYLERAWGTKRFLVFYLTCGVIAGLTNVALTFLFHQSPYILLLGASGGVLAVLAACAILFPHIQLILMFFPVPIRFAAILLIVISALFI